MVFASLSSWEIILVMLASFTFVLLAFSVLDWGKWLRDGYKDKNLALVIYVIISFAVSVLISFGIFMILAIN